jgi:hypothetical protein
VKRIRTALIAALAAATVGGPLVTEAQAKYVVTSIHQIAPNTLNYLLSHWTGSGALDTKIAALESKLAQGGVTLEGREGKEGSQGAPGLTGAAGPQGPQGEALEGPEGRASTVPGPQGPQGERGEPGEAVEGPEGKEGKEGKDTGIVGPEGPAGTEGKPGPEGKEGKASTVPGPAGPEGKTGPAGSTGPAGPEGKEGPAGSGGGTPTAYVNSSLLWFTAMPRAVSKRLLEREIPAGQYEITGQITFKDNTKEFPEEMDCQVALGGTVVDETLSINPKEEKKGLATVVFVFGTPQITKEELLNVSCENVSEAGPQVTYPASASLAALSVAFK